MKNVLSFTLIEIGTILLLWSSEIQLHHDYSELLKPFYLNIPFLYPLEMSENFWFSEIFSGLEMEHRVKVS